MNVITSKATKTEAHNTDDSRERRIISNQVHPVYTSDAERRAANGKAREQNERYNKGR